MCEFTPDPEEGIKSPFITSSFTVLCENVYKSREEAIQGLIEQLRNRRVTLQNSINSVVKRIEGLDVELHEIRYEAKYG